MTHASSVLPRLAVAIDDEGDSIVTASVIGDRLVDVEPGDTSDRLFGVSIDVGTTTVVATLMDLRAGSAAAVESTINRQAPFGADVLTRVSYTQMNGPEGSRSCAGRSSQRSTGCSAVCAPPRGSTGAPSSRSSRPATPR